jgi:N-acetylmuramoyl-L-alanine amidase CwlA
VKYLVIHYTAGRNDTAENNGQYFAREQVGASAHYFVDENTVVQSVPDEYVAWHCGGNVYYHDKCRNSNSIGIEICTKYQDGQYGFAPEALTRAQELARQLMKKYDIPVDRVIRHWDVTHKACPAPFVGAGQAAWEEFKGGLIMYQKFENVPEWAKPTVKKLVDKGWLTGDGNGNLNLTNDMVRMLVILDRAGNFGK